VRFVFSIFIFLCIVLHRCLFFFFRPLHCMSFFVFRCLITPLVSSNCSCSSLFNSPYGKELCTLNIFWLHKKITSFSVSALTWLIRYIYYWNLQFLNNVFVLKTKILLTYYWADDILRYY
jgi:hypothetical protein